MRLGTTRFLDVILVLCAVAGTAMAAWTVFQPSTATASVRDPDWRLHLSEGQRIGRPDAPFTLVVWSDYQCPFCRQYEQELRTLKARLGDSLAIVYRHFPLASSHKLATAAAVVAECAAAEGRFAAMHQALFAEPLKGDTLPADSLAKAAGISDLPAFAACSRSTPVRERIEKDVQLGRTLGITGTPAVQVGDRLTFGVITAAVTEARLRSTFPVRSR